MSGFALEAGASWRNLAWGFQDGSADSAEDPDAILVDIDTEDMDEYKAGSAKIICYFSVGTVETWRDDVIADMDAWMAVTVGNLEDWDEYWIDITSSAARTLLKTRFERAASLGCDAVELDNVDCYTADECWPHIDGLSTAAQAKAAQIEFNKWQATTAHDLSLGIGLKNALTIIDDLVDEYDFAINESCLQYGECDYYFPFLDADKAVLHTEYIWAVDACSSETKMDTSSNTRILSTKYCTGSDGLCTRGNEWKTCFVDMTSNTYANFDPDTVIAPSAASFRLRGPSSDILFLWTFLLGLLFFMRR
ncbi:Hypothetical Protein FCC1311_013562 [Hondaea fermentalgiana]|uniref:Glycoside-hydrolase family GH114 TIM-barrel domain-containing protein n=1 Tax=Hondaea fermentalgiana TaxID=2315210 RepID=A0A2R5G4A4_9STRA|nr:Hypothetical Protein FCC1311_013562 [Hondaea fermentalgiana]|eukprot:GBG25139.1 Hypothetical Protein FCC1311_013562 [Hondaea fermentalgiana]